MASLNGSHPQEPLGGCRWDVILVSCVCVCVCVCVYARVCVCVLSYPSPSPHSSSNCLDTVLWAREGGKDLLTQ